MPTIATPPIRSASYRPRQFKPQGNYPSEPLMGVELEVGGYDDALATEVGRIDHDIKHLYLKYDCSVDGVEIVTHPMTLAWARQYPFAELLTNLSDAGGRESSEYGLHIHVSRNAFLRNGKQSSVHQMMWLLFIYRNSTQLEKLARRRSSSYGCFTKPQPGELARKAKLDRRGNRFVAVNCNNDRTFELRFFKTTLKRQEFYAALEFADASVNYTRSLTAQSALRNKALSWEHFVMWVAQQDYPNLSAEIAARNIK